MKKSNLCALEGAANPRELQAVRAKGAVSDFIEDSRRPYAHFASILKH